MIKKLYIISFAAIFVALGGLNIFQSRALAEGNNNEYVLTSNIKRRTTDLGKSFEKISLFLRFKPSSKAKYWRKLLDKRLQEVELVVKNEQLYLFEDTTSRYKTYVGRYADFVISENLNDQKEITNQMLEKHAEILGTLRDGYEYESAWWLMLQQDIDVGNIFKEKINNSI